MRRSLRPALAQLRNSLACALAQVITKQDGSAKRVAVGDQHRGRASLVRLRDKGFKSGDAVLAQKICVAGEYTAAVEFAESATAGNNLRMIGSGRM